MSLRRCGVAARERHDGFERDSHFESGGARFFAARLHARVAGDSGGDRFGEFARQLIHRRVHEDLHVTTAEAEMK